MPYIPPHLRPGYTPTIKPTVDYTGKVHWPTNLDSNTNVKQPKTLHNPRTHSHTLGIISGKSALKLTDPITPNNQPIVRPGTVPAKFRPALRATYKANRKRKTIKTRKFKHSKKCR
jgi:hypothetical protein